MICPNCHANIPEGAAFCTNCGCKFAPNPAHGAYGGNYGAHYNNSTWDGSVFDTIVNSLVATLIMVCTCFIATPWAMCYMAKYVASHTVIDGKRLMFDGDGASLLGNWIMWQLLTMITCGIYGFWVTPRLYKWIASHVHFQN